jgi:hypothetical protein
MRLYDKLLTLPGGELDQVMLGGVTSFVRELEKAQCFELSEDISFAAGDVCLTRPSTLLSAIDMIRSPYEYTWVEWTPSKRNNIRDNYNAFSHHKPMPKRVGALTITNEECSRGYLILAWMHHNEDIQVSPLGLIFDWDSANPEPVISHYLRTVYGQSDPVWMNKFLATKFGDLNTSKLPDKWTRFSDDPKEREASIKLTMRGDIVPLDIFINFLTSYNIVPGAEWYESFVDDLAGELPFVEAFYLLLNSRNSIVTQVRDNFTKLNNARRKNKKPPLKEFTTTRLRISKVVGNRAASKGMTHEQARYHLVRGHFKIKYGKVFWWSPHSRGRGGSGNLRKGYEVRT